jgi:nitroimidazol reductase NimA-like FMN-containing flavoprotein (pyridoxamine 5'-phosphate oxidase superfamily)
MIGYLNSAQIDQLLSESILGRIGCSDKGKVYVVPTNYVFDGKSIIAHTLPGEKITMMRKNPEVCFEVDAVQDLLHWKSVIAWGTYQEIRDERERYNAMKLFVDKMIMLKMAIPAHSKEVNDTAGKPGSSRSIVYRIIIQEKTGRFENG